MYQTVNFPLYGRAADEYGGWAGLHGALAALGCDGIEGIWGGEDVPADLPPGLVVGYHLTFFPDWLDFYREDWPAVAKKFGSVEAAVRFYGCTGRQGLLDAYRADLARAAALGARYVVFHVSDVSLEEGYTYRWLHSHEAVIDTAVSVINTLLDGQTWPFEFLVENQWWPGFTFTDPHLTARLLDGIHTGKKGIMLDTGHLMNTCTALSTQAEGAAYLHRMLDRHGSLAAAIRGVHLHQSLSGAYVRAHTGALPPDLPTDYMQRFSASYGHIQRIDCHQPWSDCAIVPVLQRIAPAYLTHELAAPSRAARAAAVQMQRTTLTQGGLISSC